MGYHGPRPSMGCAHGMESLTVKIDTFWNLIHTAKENSGTDMDQRCENLGAELRKCSRDNIIAFSHHFSALLEQAYTWDLWGAAYRLQGGCGDDSFWDFRSSLISMGREIFEQTVNNPDSLASLSEQDAECLYFEGFQYVDSEIYEGLFGEEIPPPDVPRMDDPAGQDWDFDDEDELQRRLPKLYEKYFLS